MLTVSIKNDSCEPHLFDKDVWMHHEIGVPVLKTRSEHSINFSRIEQPWLKLACKKFVLLMSTNRSLSVLRTYVLSVTYLSRSISQHGTTGTVTDISRDMGLSYMSDLRMAGLANTTMKKCIHAVRLFLDISTREKWISIKNPIIFYTEEIPREKKVVPRFIPDMVLEQLNKNIEMFEPTIMRMLIVLQECGMRISEICTLHTDCLIVDSDGDYFLKTYQSKMSKEHCIPISIETCNVIKEQIDYVARHHGENCEWLFPVELKNRVGSRNIRSGLPYKERTITYRINSVAQIANITGSNGKPFRFQTHMFRHTVATKMINNGVPQHIVQRFLGHETPMMTSTYAHIMDSTMKREFAKFKGLMVDIAGNVFDDEAIATDLSKGADNVDDQWLKRNISAQALPNGLCAMPVVQSCDKANACLTCGNFRTDTRYLAHHKEQLERTCSILDTAKQNGWTRQIEMNERLKQNLINIIEPLEAQDDA